MLEGFSDGNADYGGEGLPEDDIARLGERGGDGVVFEDGGGPEGGDDDEFGSSRARVGGARTRDREDMEEKAEERDAGEGADERPDIDDEGAYRWFGVSAVAKQSRDGFGEDMKAGSGHEGVEILVYVEMKTWNWAGGWRHPVDQNVRGKHVKCEEEPPLRRTLT